MKVKVYKLQVNYKIFKAGTIFEEIGDKLVVQNEFSRCIDKSFFSDIKLKIEARDILTKMDSKDIKETLYYQYNMRSFDNQIKYLKDKIKILEDQKEQFLKSFS